MEPLLNIVGFASQTPDSYLTHVTTDAPVEDVTVLTRAVTGPAIVTG